MIAQATGLARIAIDETEAGMLADAASNVAQFYDVPAIAPETLAWCGLIQAVAMVYGSRIIAARAEAKAAVDARRNGNTQPQGAAPQPARAAEPPAPAMVKSVIGGVEYDVPAPGTRAN